MAKPAFKVQQQAPAAPPADAALMASLLVNPWFKALPAGLAQAMLRQGERWQLRPGEMMFRQGALPSGFFALISGSLKASTLRADGREAILAVIEPGTWFGEISLLDGLPRTHDITALERSELLVLSPAVFDELMASGDFSRAVCLLLSRRIRSLYGLVEDATLRNTQARVARRLLLLARGDATQATQPRTALSVSQESLAMMLKSPARRFSRNSGR